MSQDQFNQTSLSDDDLVRLRDILIEKYGHRIPKQDFADRVFLIFEDIAGFEFVSDSEANHQQAMESCSIQQNVSVPQLVMDLLDGVSSTEHGSGLSI